MQKVCYSQPTFFPPQMQARHTKNVSHDSLQSHGVVDSFEKCSSNILNDYEELYKTENLFELHLQMFCRQIEVCVSWRGVPVVNKQWIGRCVATTQYQPQPKKQVWIQSIDPICVCRYFTLGCLYSACVKHVPKRGCVLGINVKRAMTFQMYIFFFSQQ